MTLRANYLELAPEAIQILMDQEAYLAKQFTTSNSINKLTWELVKLRVSQINQCAFCIDMHSKTLINLGETSERIIGLSAWHDMPFYTENEKLALNWVEDLTLGNPVDDTRYQAVIQSLSEQAIVDLTIAVNAVNSWNRIAKTFRPQVGSYKP